MKKKFDINGINIDLTKNIPRGSGVGGGASNAASVLKGIRQLYNLDISDNELENIAAEIGADVPFFIRGSIQLGEGVGDRLTPLKININGKSKKFLIKRNLENFIDNILASLAVISNFLDLKDLDEKFFLNYNLPQGRGDYNYIKIKEGIITLI